MGTTPGRRHKRTMRVFYAAHGDGPWTCVACGGVIERLGQRTWDGNVHHKDDDVTNDVAENLEVLHTKCHLVIHHRPNAEMRARISAKLRGRPSPTKGMRFSDEVNRKKSRPGASNPFYGRHHTKEDLVKMRKPRRRAKCVDCGQTFALNWLTRHKSEGRCV